LEQEVQQQHLLLLELDLADHIHILVQCKHLVEAVELEEEYLAIMVDLVVAEVQKEINLVDLQHKLQTILELDMEHLEDQVLAQTI
jgi:hypothetical protein